jgi:hypothetical protein
MRSGFILNKPLDAWLFIRILLRSIGSCKSYPRFKISSKVLATSGYKEEVALTAEERQNRSKQVDVMPLLGYALFLELFF